MSSFEFGVGRVLTILKIQGTVEGRFDTFLWNPDPLIVRVGLVTATSHFRRCPRKREYYLLTNKRTLAEYAPYYSERSISGYCDLAQTLSL